MSWISRDQGLKGVRELVAVRKGGLPPLVEWHLLLGGGKPPFLTKHSRSL